MISCAENDHFILSGTASYSVVTGNDPDSLTLKAAGELEKYFIRITGKPLPVKVPSGEGNKVIFIGRDGIHDSTMLSELRELSRDGFIISATSDTLFIAGNNGKADLYAVYTLLEKYAGCMRFTEEEEYVPGADEIIIAAQHQKYEPAFSFRLAHFPDREKPGFTDWNKLSTFSEWGMFVHTFQQLMPHSEYFDSHPEYFSLVNGRRIRDGQLCLSNPEVIRILSENLGKRIAAAPEKIYWSVSQNDCINYCECSECKKLYEKYGNISGAYIDMANQIAAHFPDRQISTLAYQFTRQAPVNIVPAENVNIMFCSIECNRSMPLADDPGSAGFVRDLSEWSSLTHNIFMWDYVVQFRTY
ncbi:MAG: DUF4838 domain-containing protein, partial [Bacteroidales bacterium]|nr:DUF4838 domain-containing protein [Bacteroidales bacterium]